MSKIYRIKCFYLILLLQKIKAYLLQKKVVKKIDIKI